VPSSLSQGDFLLAIAQLGLALTAFAGFITVFKQSRIEWTPQDFSGWRFILEHACASALFALIPFPLYARWQSEADAIAVSSACLTAFLVFEIALHLRRSALLTAAGTPPRRKRLLLWVFIPATGVVAILVGLNATLWHARDPYMWALLWLLFTATSQSPSLLLDFSQTIGGQPIARSNEPMRSPGRASRKSR
jgi:hypothetical protein